MELLKQGTTKKDGRQLPGHILLTTNNIYLFGRTLGIYSMAGAQVGGIVGSLIGSAIDAAKEKKAPKIEDKSIDTEADYISLSEETKKKIKKYKSFIKIEKSSITGIKKTLFGFKFTTKNNQDFTYAGAFHKSAIAEFLQNNGYPLVS